MTDDTTSIVASAKGQDPRKLVIFRRVIGHRVLDAHSIEFFRKLWLSEIVSLERS